MINTDTINLEIKKNLARQLREKQLRIEKLERALRIIQTWAGVFDPNWEPAHKAMEGIQNYCIQVLEDKS